MPSAGRRRCAQEPRLELLAVGAVVDPFAGSRQPLTGGDACGMTHYGHHVAMATGPGAQNAKTILAVVVGDALDKARQNFRVRRSRLRPHVGVISVGLMAR